MRNAFPRLFGAALLFAFLLWLWMRPRGYPALPVGEPLGPGKVIPQIADDFDTAVLLAPDGSLWAWGGARYELSGSFSKPCHSEVPLRVGADTDWRSIGAESTFTIAIKTDGSLWGWGQNQAGELAQLHISASEASFIPPTRIGTDADWLQIAAGGTHCLALKTDGSLWSWGDNQCGQVGDGTTKTRSAVTRIGSDHDWKAIAVGDYNSYALKDNGTLWGWGASVSSSSAGPYSFAVKIGPDTFPRQIDPGTNWASISAKEYGLLALKSDGTLWVRSGPSAHSLAPAYGGSDNDSLAQIGTDANWAEVHAGQRFFYARKQDGSWWVCGNNYNGEIGLIPRNGHDIAAPTRLPIEFEAAAIATGYDGNCIVFAKDGTLWTWGQRLGSGVPQTGWKRGLEDLANRIFAHLPNHPTPFPPSQSITDTSPHKLWTLPVAARHSLSATPTALTNSPTATNLPAL
jgi:alpha-tubulin suppressor-like RCC1 family protein